MIGIAIDRAEVKQGMSICVSTDRDSLDDVIPNYKLIPPE